MIVIDYEQPVAGGYGGGGGLQVLVLSLSRERRLCAWHLFRITTVLWPVQSRRSCDLFCFLFLGPFFGYLVSGLTCVYSLESSSLSYSDCPLNTMYGFGCLFYNRG